MPFSGGNYSAPSNSWNPAVTGTTINATDWASLLADLSTALSTCVLKDGSQTVTGNLPMSGFKLTGLSAGSTSGDSVRYEQVLLLAGGTMSGNIAMGGNKITGLAAATANGDAVRYEQSPAGLLSAKGALITASAANTPAILGVGTNGYALIANSSAANGVNWGIPVIRSYLAGCGMSTAGSSATMSIAAGLAVDSTNVSAMSLSAISKTTSAWSVGTGNGGLDTGSIANSTWYHFYVIQRPDTGVVDVIFSTSATAPTLPTNYTLYRRIGSGKTDGSAQWVAFVQDGDLFQWTTVPALSVDTTNPGTLAVTATLAVPTGINVQAIFNAQLKEADNTVNQLYFSDLDTTDSAPSVTAAPLSNLTMNTTVNETTSGMFQIRTNTSAQIRYRVAASGAITIVRVATRGWIDRRGRDS